MGALMFIKATVPLKNNGKTLCRQWCQDKYQVRKLSTASMNAPTVGQRAKTTAKVPSLTSQDM